MINITPSIAKAFQRLVTAGWRFKTTCPLGLYFERDHQEFYLSHSTVHWVGRNGEVTPGAFEL